MNTGSLDKTASQRELGYNIALGRETYGKKKVVLYKKFLQKQFCQSEFLLWVIENEGGLSHSFLQKHALRW